MRYSFPLICLYFLSHINLFLSKIWLFLFLFFIFLTVFFSFVFNYFSYIQGVLRRALSFYIRETTKDGILKIYIVTTLYFIDYLNQWQNLKVSQGTLYLKCIVFLVLFWKFYFYKVLLQKSIPWSYEIYGSIFYRLRESWKWKVHFFITPLR